MRTEPSSIVGSCDTGKGADSTQTENSREFPWSAGITILWSAVVAVVSLVIALAAGLGVSLVEVLLEPVGVSPEVSDSIGRLLFKKLSDHQILIVAVQGLTVLVMIFLLTRSRDGLTRTRMLGLEAIKIGKCAIWALSGLLTIIAATEIAKLFVDFGEEEAIKWMATFRPVWIGLFVIVVVAPLSEELLFRGFIYGGLAQSIIGPLGAILTTSVIWAALHIQYTWLIIMQIFLYGVVFGVVRWKSGSLWPPIISHCLNNLIVGVLFYSGFYGS